MARQWQRDPAREQFWRKTFREWEGSSKTRHQFCIERKLATSAFDYWRREIVRRDAQRLNQKRDDTPVLIPIKVIAATPLEVKLLNGRSILVPAGFDANHLRTLLDVLEGQPC